MPKPDISELKAALGPESVYVGWLDARMANDLFASTGRVLCARWVYRIQPGAEIRWERVFETQDPVGDVAARRRIWAYSSSLDRAAAWTARVPDDPLVWERGRELYQLMFGGALDDIAGVRHLVSEFSSEDGLAPSIGLVCPDGSYLGDHYAISLSPSAAVYVTLRKQSLKAASRAGVLAIGDPVFSEDEARPATGRIDVTLLRDAIARDPVALDRLPRLPFAGEEVQHVAGLFANSRVLQGSDASEQAVAGLARSGELTGYRIVHVASHALVDNMPDRCAIALSRENIDSDDPANDGLLDANEIRYGWHLNADLVTLSGCQTVGGGWLRGEPVGFVQDLFAAGARCVLVSRWKVDDLATSMLMAKFYENLAEGDDGDGNRSVAFDEALAAAKIWLRTFTDDTGGHPFAHPVYWSGFVLVGNAN
jgi:hypothetical protein